MVELEELKTKCEEQKNQINLLLKKIETYDKSGSLYRKGELGLIPKKLYLIITHGRRIVGKLVFENKSFICYSKREGTKYYCNKSSIDVIKEMSVKEEEGYLKSNFDT